jgi:mRNA interferase RelE/StbE
MASYNVVLKPAVVKDFRSLPKPIIARALAGIERLKENPVPRGAIKLAGAEELYRLRIGDYRLIYGIDKAAGEVVVHHLRHRRDAYRRI